MAKKIVQNLLYKDLSYQIHGAAIEVRKDFGSGHKEKLYQNALAKELRRRDIVFEKEKPIKIYAPKDGNYVGLYRPDFIIDDKIIVEVKAEKFVMRSEIKRIYDYLRNSKYELAYFINFASSRLFVKRIILTNDRKPHLRKILVSISLILVSLGGLLSFRVTKAAEFFLQSEVSAVAPGSRLKVDVYMDTEEEAINAFLGTIVYPGDILDLQEIRDGGSVVTFWVTNPRIATNKKTNGGEYIVFSGAVPGGYTGRKGFLFSMIFEARGTARNFTRKSAEVTFHDIKAYLNDGLGTEADVSARDFSFMVLEEAPVSEVYAREDKDAPEEFTPVLGRDPNLFDNKWFVAFAAQDKGSGIDKYLIYESRRIRERIPTNDWVLAESPYVLKDQRLRSYVYVKAVDKSGNERIAVLPPQNNGLNPIFFAVFGIIIVIGGFLKWKKLIH